MVQKFLSVSVRVEKTLTGLNISETTSVNMKRFLKSSLKGKDKEGKKVNLNKYLKVKLKNSLKKFCFCLQNSQVVSINWEQEDSLDLVSFLYKEGEEKYIGYLKPTREDLASLVIVVTEVDTRLQVIG